MVEAEVQAGGLQSTAGQVLQTFTLKQVTSSTQRSTSSMQSSFIETAKEQGIVLIAGMAHWQQVPVVVGIGQLIHLLRHSFHFVTHPLFAAKSRDTVFLVSVLRASPLDGSLAGTNVSRMYFEAAHFLTRSSDHLEEGRSCAATTSAPKQAATAPRATSLVLKSGRPNLRRTG